MAEKELQSAEQYMQSLGRDIHARIEKPNWSPWLSATPEQIAERIRIFPQGHMIFKGENSTITGFLSTNRVHWDGQHDSLTTWDEVAGADRSFANSYQPSGNTICLMSMGVAAGARGQHVAQRMIEGIQDIAHQHAVEHIIGDFRPSGYGAHKHMTGNFDFESYVKATRSDGLPLDPWLRNVTYQGMNQLKIDPRAMIVRATNDELLEYMVTYKPDSWYQVEDPAEIKVLLEQHRPELELSKVTHIYECEETGTWYVDVDNNEAVYIESNIWGELPLQQPNS